MKESTVVAEICSYIKTEIFYEHVTEHEKVSERSNNRYIQSFESAMMEGMLRIGEKAGACVREWLQIIGYLE